MMKLRLAQESDANQLVSMAQIFLEGAKHSNYEDVLEYLKNSGDIICVVEYNSTVVGYCCGRISRHLSFEEPIADILEIFLMKDYRGKGIGKILLDYMEAEFTRRGAERVRIFVRQGSESARKFYSACGYNEFDMVMCRKDNRANTIQ